MNYRRLPAAANCRAPCFPLDVNGKGAAGRTLPIGILLGVAPSTSRHDLLRVSGHLMDDSRISDGNELAVDEFCLLRTATWRDTLPLLILVS